MPLGRKKRGSESGMSVASSRVRGIELLVVINKTKYVGLRESASIQPDPNVFLCSKCSKLNKGEGWESTVTPINSVITDFHIYRLSSQCLLFVSDHEPGGLENCSIPA